MQGGANLVNDLKDAESGVDDDSRKGSLAGCPSWISFSVAGEVFLPGDVWCSRADWLGLSLYGGWGLLLLAFLSIVAAYAYTGGPKPLSHIAMGSYSHWSSSGP